MTEWEDTELERHVSKRLGNTVGSSMAQELIANYRVARSQVLKLAEEIKAREPYLSDHGPRHVRDVLQNAWELVKGQKICTVNLYVLCLSIAYHDMGNFFGRKDHNQKIAKIFNDTFPNNDEIKRSLRILVTKIAGAHTGKALDGGDDTLQDFQNNSLYFQKKPIDAQSIAAILRFSDEMAEGPQRTSGIRLRSDDYPKDSKPFHIYADCCDPCASNRANGRVSLTYNIPIEVAGDQIVYRNSDYLLSELLTLIYKRVVKFDQERKYCRYYSPVLAVFKETSAYIHFVLDDEDVLNLGLEPLVLNDLVVPGDASKAIHEVDPAYDVENILNKIKEICDDNG